MAALEKSLGIIADSGAATASGSELGSATSIVVYACASFSRFNHRRSLLRYTHNPGRGTIATIFIKVV